MALCSTFGSLEGVDLGCRNGFGFDMCSKVAAAAGPFARGVGVARAEFFTLELAQPVAAFTLVNGRA